MDDKEAYGLMENLVHEYWDKGYQTGRASAFAEIVKIISERIQDSPMRGDIALSDLLREVKDLG
jgi:hypothetical protein